MILVFLIQLNKVRAPAPYSDDKLLVILRMLLRVPQHISIDRIQL